VPRVRRTESIGQPIGSAMFLEQLEKAMSGGSGQPSRGRRPQEQLSALSP